LTAILGRRLAATAALFLALCVLEVATGDYFGLLVALALLIVPVLSWATFYFFAVRAMQPDAPFVLKIRVQDALALAIASSVGAVLGFVVVLRQVGVLPAVDRAVFLVGLSFALLMIAAPAVNWLIVWTPWKAEAPE
jgi:hypothetical protein